MNLLSPLLGSLVNQGSAYRIAGLVPRRMGNAHPSIAPYDLYQASDRYVVLAVGNDRQFAALSGALGFPGLARDPRFEANSERVRHRDALRAELEQRLRTRPASDWTRHLTDARVPAGVVNDIAEALQLATALGLDPVAALAREDGSQVSLVRNPIELSETPVSYRSAPPALPTRQTAASARW